MRVRGVAVRGRLGLGEPPVPLRRRGPRRRQLPARLLELVLQGVHLLRRRVARGLRVPVLVLQLGDVVVEPLGQRVAAAGLADVRRAAERQRDEQQHRERGAVPGEEAGDGVALPGIGFIFLFDLETGVCAFVCESVALLLMGKSEGRKQWSKEEKQVRVEEAEPKKKQLPLAEWRLLLLSLFFFFFSLPNYSNRNHPTPPIILT